MRKVNIITSTTNNTVITSATTVGELAAEQGLTLNGQIATLNGASATADSSLAEDNTLYLIPMMKAANN